MARTKNYETVSKFVKVMHKKYGFFIRIRCIA